jgi:ribosome-associated heat shock protein Hsp15
MGPLPQPCCCRSAGGGSRPRRPLRPLLRMDRSPLWRCCAIKAPAHDLAPGESVTIPDQEDRDWQRLDKWLWCARVMRARADCNALVGQGGVRINRQPTEKAHARLRVGDVVTLPVRGDVRVLRVVALAARRGPAAEARTLYEEIGDVPPPSCAGPESPAYRPLQGV